jgi:Zn-dependent protease with chaperone function
MDADRWEALVRRLETVARKDPKGYRRRVALLAALGFGCLGAVFVALVAGTAYAVVHAFDGHPLWLKLALPLGLLALAVVRAAWVKLPEPDGVPVRRPDAPTLHALIDELRTQLAVKPLDRVLVVEELNAAVAQTPRWGLFGPQRSTLLIGLPLMQALPEPELRAVLAHELGHLSGNHSRFSGWIYRLRATWGRLLEALEAERHIGTFAFSPFFEWYAPYFSAYTFALARDDEYVADAAAAEAAGTAHAASALTRIALADRFEQERHWTPIFEHAAHRASPPQDPFSALATRLRCAAADHDAPRWLAGALARKTDHADTHPALGDRLVALGVTPGSAIEPFDGPSSAETLLGPLEHTLAARFDADWREAAQVWWSQRHTAAHEGRRRLAELAGRDDLTPDEAFERARLTAKLHGDDAAEPLLFGLLVEQPDHARARYALGTVLLERGDETGLEQLDAAVRLDREATLGACEAAIAFLEERGRAAEAAHWHELAKGEARLVAAAYEQRSRFHPDERVRPYEASAEEREQVRAAVAEEGDVAKAYLVQKDVPDHPGVPPLLIVAVEIQRSKLKLERQDADQQLAVRIADRLAFDGPYYVLPLTGEAKGLRQRLEGAVAPVYAA